MSDTRASPPPALKHSSWRLAPATADQLTSRIEDFRYQLRTRHGLRVPRYRILGALVEVALSHPEEVEARLKGGDQPCESSRS
jgi:hypothetical protein